MALATNGTIGNYLKRTGNMPAWGTSALIGFFQYPTDTLQHHTLIQFGGAGGFIALRQSDTDLSLFVYHDWGSWGSTLTQCVPGRWYGIFMGASGTAAKMMLLDLSTGTVYTSSGTNPGGSFATTVDEVWFGSYTYGARSAHNFAGFRLHNESFSDERVYYEWGSPIARIRTNLLGEWPMWGPDKASGLIDRTGNGDLVETGTAIAFAADSPPVTPGGRIILMPRRVSASADLTGAFTFAGMTAAGAATVDVAGTGAFTFAGMTAAGTATGDIAATGAFTLAGMTVAATATGDIAATGAFTFAGMTAAGTGTVDIAATGSFTFAGMTAAGTATGDIAGTGAFTFAGMTAAGDIVVGSTPISAEAAFTFEGMTASGAATVTDPPAPEPPSPPPPTTNFAGGGSRRKNRVLVRVDGRLHEVDYAEAAEIIARQAEEDAARERAEKSKRQARARARAAAQGLKARLIIDEPVQIDGVDPAIIADRMFKDLRDVYSQRFIETLINAKALQRKQADEKAAMAAAEMLLMGDGN